jgi:hypothetical protein
MATADRSQLLEIEFPGCLKWMGMRSTWFGTKLFYPLNCNNKLGRCRLVYGCWIAGATRWLIMRIPHLSDDTVFRQQHPKLDPSIGSRIWATKVRHLVSFDAIILISTTHDCYDCLSSSIHPRDRHWFTKYRIMGLGHKVLAGDAVLTSGLDGESSVVGEPFWRSFDANDMTQEVRFLHRSLRELSEAVDAQAAAWVRVSTHHEHTFNYVWPVSLDWLSWPQVGRRDESSCWHCTSCSLPPSWINLRRFTIDVRISIDCWNSASTLWELDWKLSTPISSMADSVNMPGRRNVVPMRSFADTMKCGNPFW